MEARRREGSSGDLAGGTLTTISRGASQSDGSEGPASDQSEGTASDQLCQYVSPHQPWRLKAADHFARSRMAPPARSSTAHPTPPPPAVSIVSGYTVHPCPKKPNDISDRSSSSPSPLNPRPPFIRCIFSTLRRRARLRRDELAQCGGDVFLGQTGEVCLRLDPSFCPSVIFCTRGTSRPSSDCSVSPENDAEARRAEGKGRGKGQSTEEGKDRTEVDAPNRANALGSIPFASLINTLRSGRASLMAG